MKKQRIAFFIICLLYAFTSISFAQVDSELDNIGNNSNQNYDSPQAIEQAYYYAERLEDSQKYFGAASVFFNVYTVESKFQDRALAKVTENLIRVKLYNAASYFFIKTLQSQDRNAIKSVLRYLPTMLDQVGGDLLRKYILKYTQESDYDNDTRNHFYYYLGKEALLKGESQSALSNLAKISSDSDIKAQAHFLRGTAFAILNQNQNAISEFDSCRRIAGSTFSKKRMSRAEAQDLEYRCTASLARTYYQAGNHEKSEDIYDDIPKSSFVWTDILFEQAWNSFAKQDYNRTLGKLVSYRSPSLKFVFNPEVDVLRAQTFLVLCMYEDVNKSVTEFNSRYGDVGIQMKSFISKNQNDLKSFFALARSAYSNKLHTQNELYRALNRVIRTPYFTNLISQEKTANKEIARVRAAFGSNGKSTDYVSGFGGFLENVIQWRKKSIELLGGAFAKNSMIDLYQELLADFDKISYIKLDMLSKAKAALEHKQAMSADENGVMKKGKADINRKDYQYFWSFNGEFWLDELGDYVFSLESECAMNGR